MVKSKFAGKIYAYGGLGQSGFVLSSVEALSNLTISPTWLPSPVPMMIGDAAFAHVVLPVIK